MNENVIEWINGETVAHVTLTSRHAGRIKRLAEQHPDEVQIIAANKDGSILAHVPMKWVTIRKPKKYNYSDEEMKVRSERMKLLRMRQLHGENEANFDLYAAGGEIFD